MKDKETVIFLDMDGVICNWESRVLNPNNLLHSVSPTCLGILDLLIKHTNGIVVISSSWRTMTGIDKEWFEKTFSDLDYEIPIHDDWRTISGSGGFNPLIAEYEVGDRYYSDSNLYRNPLSTVEEFVASTSYWRGWQIQEWLSRHKDEYANYLIIDDDDDMLLSQKEHFVHIQNGEVNGGLLFKHIQDYLDLARR